MHEVERDRDRDIEVIAATFLSRASHERRVSIRFRANQWLGDHLGQDWTESTISQVLDIDLAAMCEHAGVTRWAFSSSDLHLLAESLRRKPD